MLTNLVGVLLAQRNDDAAAAVLAAFAGIWLMVVLFSLAMLAFMIFCWWRIFERTGYGGPFAFLILIPGFGPLIVVLLLAFGDWPALRNRQV
jgi:hypothetical protein